MLELYCQPLSRDRAAQQRLASVCRDLNALRRGRRLSALTSPRRSAPEDIPAILDKPEDENVDLLYYLYHQTLREYADRGKPAGIQA